MHEGGEEVVVLLAGRAREAQSLLELAQGGAVIPDHRVLGAEVEVDERGRRALGLLGLQELQVAARLLLGVADRAQVAVVVDSDRALLEPAIA